MVRFYQRLGFKISLTLSLIAVPILALTAWRVINNEIDAVERLTLEKGETAAAAGAQAVGTLLDNGVHSGDLVMDDLLNPIYTKIHFPGISVEYPRYHTQFDSFFDTHGIQAIEDAILHSSTDLIYSVGSDKNAYVPVTHSEYSEPPTGDVAHDRQKSRSKRKFDRQDKDAMQLAASAYLGKEPLVQIYHRDTGDNAWDVSVPIWVNKQHFGAFRVGVRMDQIAAHKRDLIIQLSEQFGILTILLIGFIFIMVHLAMRKLNNLVTVSIGLSKGDGLENKVVANSNDEVGAMSKAVELLRKSLSAAMRRLT